MFCTEASKSGTDSRATHCLLRRIRRLDHDRDAARRAHDSFMGACGGVDAHVDGGAEVEWLRCVAGVVLRKKLALARVFCGVGERGVHGGWR